MSINDEEYWKEARKLSDEIDRRMLLSIGALGVGRGLQTHPMASGALAGTAMNSAASQQLFGMAASAPKPPAYAIADIQHAATEGRNTERDRMLARLMSMEPSRELYSKPQSEWGRREARRLWERMRDAIVDGKEAHKDRDAQ